MGRNKEMVVSSMIIFNTVEGLGLHALTTSIHPSSERNT